MARKATAPSFGSEDGPRFGSLQTPEGKSVAGELAEWYRTLNEQKARAPDDNFGWLRVVYIVPSALGRAWQQLASMEEIVRHDWEGRKRCRLRGVIQFDEQAWASTSPAEAHDVALCQLLPPDAVRASVAQSLFTWPERQADNLQRLLGRNAYGVGPVYPKAGDTAYALGWNVKVIPAEGLSLGQFFKVNLPPAPTW